jgi:hypothetical protein
VSGDIDTGATHSLMTVESSRAMELVTTEIPPVSITYADGHIETSHQGALLGSHPVIVVGNLVNNLISPIEMLDHAGTRWRDKERRGD